MKKYRIYLQDHQPGHIVDAEAHGHRLIVKRIGRGTTTLGFIALAGSGLDQWDDAVATQAAAALHLERVKQQAVDTAQARVGGELLHGFVTGALADTLIVWKRASDFGFDPSRPHAAVVVESDDAAVSTTMVRERLQDVLRREHITAPLALFDQTVLCPLPVDRGLEHVWKFVHTLAAEAPIRPGISDPAATASDWQRAYNEAQHALALSNSCMGSGAWRRIGTWTSIGFSASCRVRRRSGTSVTRCLAA